MTIPLTGAGSYFVRTGHLGGGVLDCLALSGGAATARVTSGASFPARITNVVEPDYANGTAIPQIISDALQVISTVQSGLAGAIATLVGEAQRTLLAMYAIDQQAVPNTAPQAQLTNGFSYAQALATLIAQMNTAAASVQAATVTAGAQTAAGSPNGNAVIVVSLKNPQGLLLQLVFPETITFRCTSDSQSGGAAAGNEPLLATGQVAVNPQTSYLWPGGSGCAQSFNCVDGSKSNSTGNLLQNSDFFTATTSNIPDNWTLGVGVAGADVFQTTSSANVYTTGGGAVEFLGTSGALLDGITQAFATAPSTAVSVGGTSAALKPDTVYHVNCWVKLTNASPSTGVLQFSLIDGGAYPGTVINDDQAAANTFTQSLTGYADTSWHNISGAFRTPAVMPTTTPVARLRVRLSTAIDNGKGVFIGRLSMTPAAQLYPGGPYCSIHSGNARLIAGVNPDAWTVATTNTYSTSGQGLMQQLLERIFGLRALGLQLPYSGSPTAADSLIA